LVARSAESRRAPRETDESAEILLLERAPDVSYAVGGLAHALGGEVDSLAKLDREKARFFRDTYNVEVRTGVDVKGFDAGGHMVDASGTNVPYDQLIIATGARSVAPPIEELSAARNVFFFRRLSDLKGILRLLDRGARRVVILGGGHFGVEAAEGFLRRRPRLRVTLVGGARGSARLFSEGEPSSAGPEPRERSLRTDPGLRLGGKIVRELHFDDGTSVAADLVSPRAASSRDPEARGRETHADGSSGPIPGADQPPVYACGVAVAVGTPSRAARSDGAGSGGRPTAQVAGANAAEETRSSSMLGTAILRAGDVVLARTGWTEGRGPEVEVARIHAPSHDPFLPGASDMAVDVHFDPRQGRLLGAEVVGGEGTDKRIDVLAASILGKLSVSDLARIDLAYQAPFARARDAVNVAGTVAASLRAGKVRAYSSNEVERAKGVVVVDVDGERTQGTAAIPLEEIRGKLKELGGSREGRPGVPLETGRRGYLAARIAASSGIDCGYLSGGTR
jgi:NADPH-dependent 2,4-dienoyl-CoA reductase/sulfur reductase-like enzyme